MNVSIVMPTHNRAHLIGDAIRSILDQTYQGWELIIIDDGSTDNTADVVGAFSDSRIRYIRQENQGVAAARNTGIRQSRGEFIAFLDSDDLWRPDKLEKQIAHFCRQSHAAMVYGRSERHDIRDQGRRVVPEVLASNFLELLEPPQRIFTPTVMVRREVFERTGLFDEQMEVGEDYDLWLRIAAHYEIAAMDEVLSEHRVHGANTGSNLMVLYRGYYVLCDKLVKRYSEQLGKERDVVYRKSAKYAYLWGAQCAKQGGDWKQASRLIGEAVHRNRRVGLEFLKTKSNGMAVASSLLKPYFAFTYAKLRDCLALKKRKEHCICD